MNNIWFILVLTLFAFESPCAFGLSPNGSSFIQRLEGFREKPYQDSDGQWVIGYGCKIYKTNMTVITRLEAQKMLEAHAKKVENVVQSFFEYPLKPHQKDALISFVYNIGINAFKNSKVYAALKNKDFERAALYWKSWVHDSKGKVLKGLVKRRKEEVEMFLS